MIQNQYPREHANAAPLPQGGVHLVGSIPLGDAETVFRTVVTELGDRLHRLPDGETTRGRLDWIMWQRDLFLSHPAFEEVPVDAVAARYRRMPQVRLRTSCSAEELSFEELGYAQEALASYEIFAHLKREGLIPLHLRFQVGLPTPLNLIATFVTLGDDQAIIEPAYEAAMRAEVDKIAAAIPHTELAIQWETPMELALLEQQRVQNPRPISPHLSNLLEDILTRLTRLGSYVPEHVELGYHLCYGDAGHRHFVEPVDAQYLAELATGISQRLSRSIEWIHMPVPRNRDDEAYFAPLAEMHVRDETELYLGLVHYTDGVTGTLRRIATAKHFVSSFGVATECGFGRRDPATIPELLRIHREVSLPLEKMHQG